MFRFVNIYCMDILSATECAGILKISRERMSRYCREGRIPQAVRKGRVWLIPREDFERFRGVRRAYRPGRVRDRYRHGLLPKCRLVLCGKRSAASLIVRALNEEKIDPFRDSRERALLTAVLREQIRHYGWESLPESRWSEIDSLVRFPSGVSTRQISQEVRYIQYRVGEIAYRELSVA